MKRHSTLIQDRHPRRVRRHGGHAHRRPRGARSGLRRQGQGAPPDPWRRAWAASPPSPRSRSRSTTRRPPSSRPSGTDRREPEAARDGAQEPRARQRAAHEARPEHLQVARRRRHRRDLRGRQLRRADQPDGHDGAARQQRRRHRPRHRRLQARHQGPPPQARGRPEGGCETRRRARGPEERAHRAAGQAPGPHRQDQEGDQAASRPRRSLRAQLALTGYSGPIPGPVDPNSPGHPEIVSIAQRYFGVPYVWGGASPSGFDCSGLTMYCFAQLGVGMSHGATDQQRASIPVAAQRPAPGRPHLLRQRELQPPRGDLRQRHHHASRRRTPALSCATARSRAATPGSAAASRRRLHETGRSEGPAALPPGLRRLRLPSATFVGRIARGR